MKEIIQIMPSRIKEYLACYSYEEWKTVEEIRLRIGKPVEVIQTDKPVNSHSVKSPLFSEKDASMMMGLISRHSVYRLEEELRRGYITIPGGHRVGIAGRVLVEQGHVRGLREIGSFNVRIAKEKVGVSHDYIPYLYKNGRWQNTLIIGPPKSGKTTLLRDLARQISSGVSQKGIRARNTAIIDERSEIAGCIHGIPQHQFGTKIDVLDGCPKAEGMMMMIRSMSPEILIVDEIGRDDDVTALMEAIHAGVTVICSVHSTSAEDAFHRPGINRLLDENAFDGAIELGKIGRKGIYKRLKFESGLPNLERKSL